MLAQLCLRSWLGKMLSNLDLPNFDFSASGFIKILWLSAPCSEVCVEHKLYYIVADRHRPPKFGLSFLLNFIWRLCLPTCNILVYYHTHVLWVICTSVDNDAINLKTSFAGLILLLRTKLHRHVHIWLTILIPVEFWRVYTKKPTCDWRSKTLNLITTWGLFTVALKSELCHQGDVWYTCIVKMKCDYFLISGKR